MGIDRPDEDDETDVAHDSAAIAPDTATAGYDPPDAVDGHDDTDFRAVQAAYNLEYRASVEGKYATAWAEAVLGLRQRWEELKERYPHPERSQSTLQADGSWHGEGVLKLSPEQNDRVDRHCELIREVGENVIAPAMRRIEAEDPDRHLVGYDNRFKEPDRLKEKVAEELRPPSTLTVAEALSAVPDGVRFTLSYRESGYADGVRVDVDRLTAEGFELMKVKNTWTKDQYKGINSQWRELASDVRFEVQFHTPESVEAKELSHKAYERLRGDSSQDDEREELEAFQSAVCARIRIPPGAIDIEDYPPEKHDG